MLLNGCQSSICGPQASQSDSSRQIGNLVLVDSMLEIFLQGNGSREGARASRKHRQDVAPHRHKLLIQRVLRVSGGAGNSALPTPTKAQPSAQVVRSHCTAHTTSPRPQPDRARARATTLRSRTRSGDSVPAECMVTMNSSPSLSPCHRSTHPSDVGMVGTTAGQVRLGRRAHGRTEGHTTSSSSPCSVVTRIVSPERAIV